MRWLVPGGGGATKIMGIFDAALFSENKRDACSLLISCRLRGII